MRLAALALILLALVLPAEAANYNRRDVLMNAVDGYIRPGFDQLAEEAASLWTNIYDMCGEPNETTLETSRNQFKSTVIAYSRVEFLRFGPVTEADRSERLLFWPDRKGIALRQVQAILADYDETTTELSDLRKKSVAVQGLGALEYVLFGERSERLATIESDFRCRYAQTIAEAVAATSKEIADAWNDPAGIADRLSLPRDANADYRNNRESLEALIGALAHGIENVRDTRLLPFVGRDGSKPKPKSALFWRSVMSVPSIRANFEGLRDFFVTSRMGEATSEKNAGVDAAAKAEFEAALATSDKVTLPVDQAVADAAQKQALVDLIGHTQMLQKLIGEDLPAALELSVGFSSADGD